MVKLPRIRIPPPRRWPGLSLLLSVRGRIIVGFGLLVLILVAVVAASAWLTREHRSALAQMEVRSEIADALEDAALNSTQANLLLERYLVTGNEAVIPMFRSNITQAADDITQAHVLEDSRGKEGTGAGFNDAEEARLHELAAGIASLSETFEQVTALMQAGNAEEARQALEAAVPAITGVRSAIGEAADMERQEIPTLRSRADRTGELAFWFAVIAGAVGAALGAAAAAFVARSILRPLSSLEATALAIAEGDLETRADINGPREFAHLGASLNRMTESLLDASKRRELEAERERAYTQLRESEERYRDLIENANDIVYSHDLEGHFTSVNGACERIMGYTPDEMLKMDIAQILAPEHLEMAREMIRRKVEGGDRTTYELEIIAKDGHRVPLEVSTRLILRKGKLVGVQGIARDISDRKRAEEALRESEEKFRGLVESAPNAIVIVDGDGRIVLVNAQTEETFGYSRDELIGQPVETLVPEHLRKTHAGHRASYHSDPHTRPMGSGLVLAARRKDGSEFPVAVSLSPQQSKDGTIVTSIIRDITELKQAEETLQRLNQELEADQKAIEELNRSLEERVRQRTDELRLANEELRERNRQLLDARARAVTDGLTGLSNHRAFHERIHVEVQRARETGSSVGLIMLDIDGFKRVNDSLGHLAGDKILRELALTIAKVTKRENAYRYGGDEFAVLMPGAGCNETMRAAERLRRAVAKATDGSGPGVTISLGIACLPDSAESAEELIYGADAAMYWAKSAGKNRVGDWRSLIQQSATGYSPWYLTDRVVKTPDVVAALVAALAAKDPTTAAHTERCSWYSGKLAQELGLSEEDSSIVRLASLLHDIGKLAVPDEVLCKPGPLTEEEWAQMKQHPSEALNVLAQIRSIADTTPAILHHHEHFDGTGYPDGLAGDNIPVASRILLVADAFDAMTTDRPYRDAMPVEVAIDELRHNSGTQFDPVVVDAFLKVLSRQGAQPLGHKANNHEEPIERKRPARKSKARASTRQRRRAEPASSSAGSRN